MNRALFLIAATTLLVGCSQNPSEPVVTTPATTRQPTIIDPQLKALDSAKKVQATLDEADRKRRQAMEDAGG